MAVLIALALGTALAYRGSKLRWPFVLPAGAVALELAINAVRFGVRSVIVWGIVLSVLTVFGGISGLRLGEWLRRRNTERPAP